MVAKLVGVRVERGAPLLLVGCVHGQVERGDPVVVDIAGQPTLAVVDVPAALILSAPPGEARGRIIAHGESDPVVRDALLRLDAAILTTTRAIVGENARVTGVQRSRDGAWVTVHLASPPSVPSEDLTEPLAAALHAAIRLTWSEKTPAP
ncbi:MAG TPA: hypothetical protein VKX96_13100 [Chloroflexota bacterium]|nr:hypothetical protein [Chloroflexota bacterium]